MNSTNSAQKKVIGVIILLLGINLMFSAFGFHSLLGWGVFRLIFSPINWVLATLTYYFFSKSDKRRSYTFGTLFLISSIATLFNVSSFGLVLALLIIFIGIRIAVGDDSGVSNAVTNAKGNVSTNDSVTITDTSNTEKTIESDAVEASAVSVDETVDSSVYSDKEEMDTFRIEIFNILADSMKAINVKKVKGGTIINILGSTKVDLTKVEVFEDKTLEIINILGEVKLYMPKDCRVISNELTILGSQKMASVETFSKTLKTTGVTVMGESIVEYR